MDFLIQLSESHRLLSRRVKVALKGFHSYKGNPQEICKQIIEECWNGKYFQTSLGNFTEFWTRDFGYCCKALLNLGYKEEVLQTLDYALHIFRKYDRITTTINPHEKPLDIFTYSPDSLPILLMTLRLSKASALVSKYKKFLESEVKKYIGLVINKETKLVKDKKAFSSIKDNAIRSSSMYNNCMIALLSKELDNINIKNPLKKIDYEKLITGMFWTGDYFLDDLSEHRYIAGDANVFPFWTGAIKSKEKLMKCIRKIQEAELDSPFPLKYTKVKEGKYLLIPELFTPNYEGNSIWMHLGLIYIEQVMEIDKKQAEKYIKEYQELIKKYKTFLEVFNPDETPYKSLIYMADEGMLWASIYLYLYKMLVNN
ncbi:hypothetical protein JW930_06285 [Candidatus Woesearchaeota archaeon]|nr:hypothetical protein [Candidatus Woesearchaeota archaeon]